MSTDFVNFKENQQRNLIQEGEAFQSQLVFVWQVAAWKILSHAFSEKRTSPRKCAWKMQ